MTQYPANISTELDDKAAAAVASLEDLIEGCPDYMVDRFQAICDDITKARDELLQSLILEEASAEDVGDMKAHAAMDRARGL